MIRFCKYILVVNGLILTFVAAVFALDLEISGGTPMDLAAYVAAWYTILVLPISSLGAAGYLVRKRKSQALPGSGIRVGGRRLRLVVAVLLVAMAGGLHLAARRIQTRGKARAEKGEALQEALEAKQQKLEEREAADESVSPDAYEAIDRERMRIARTFPPYYHTLNRVVLLYVLELTLLILAVGLPLARSTAEQAGAPSGDEQVREQNEA